MKPPPHATALILPLLLPLAVSTATEDLTVSTEQDGPAISVATTRQEIVYLHTPEISTTHDIGTSIPGTSSDYVMRTGFGSVITQCASKDDPEIYFQVYPSCQDTPHSPQAPTPLAGQAPRTQTITVTSTDVSRLIVGGSGITRQPEAPVTRLDMPLIAYTSPDTRTYTTTVLGATVTITATPTKYTWGWGDSTTTSTTDPGQPYPNHTVYHYYSRPAKDLTLTLTTTWKATYTTPDGTTRPVQGTITTTQTSTPFEVRDYTSVLTDTAEEAQGR